MKRTIAALLLAGLVITLGLMSAKAAEIDGLGEGQTVDSDVPFTVTGSAAFDTFGNFGQSYDVTLSGTEDGAVTGTFCYGTACGLLFGTISATALESGKLTPPEDSLTSVDGTFTALGGSLMSSFPSGSSVTLAFKDIGGTDIFSSGTIFSSVPEPGSLLLLGSGLLSLAGFARRRMGASR